MRKAWAVGYHRYCIRDRSYPALCAGEEQTDRRDVIVVQGVLVLDLSENDLHALDSFEGPEYVRSAIKVRLDNEDTVDAFTYLWAKGRSDPQLYGMWSFERDFLPKEEITLKEWGFL